MTETWLHLRFLLVGLGLRSSLDVLALASLFRESATERPPLDQWTSQWYDPHTWNLYNRVHYKGLVLGVYVLYLKTGHVCISSMAAPKVGVLSHLSWSVLIKPRSVSPHRMLCLGWCELTRRSK